MTRVREAWGRTESPMEMAQHERRHEAGPRMIVTTRVGRQLGKHATTCDDV